MRSYGEHLEESAWKFSKRARPLLSEDFPELVFSAGLAGILQVFDQSVAIWETQKQRYGNRSRDSDGEFVHFGLLSERSRDDPAKET
jgi:hypothetical protein